MMSFLKSQFGNPVLLAKYILSGLTAATVQLGSLSLLVERAGMHHLQAVMCAFILSAIVAFIFQKFWTFSDKSLSRVHFQAGVYLILAATAFGLTTLFMYIFVDLFHIWYIFAQVVTIGLVTIVTFLCNKNIVFKRNAIVTDGTPNTDISGIQK